MNTQFKRQHGLIVKVQEGKTDEGEGGTERKKEKKRQIKAHHQDKYSDKSL